MFERFTDRGRRVVVLAQENARSLGDDYIGVQHILLGLIDEGQGVAGQVLGSLGISQSEFRGRFAKIGIHRQDIGLEHIPFDPRAKMALEQSVRESRQLGHAYVGTEHILLGLVSDADGPAAQILAELGADYRDVRGRTLRELGELGEASAAQVRPPTLPEPESPSEASIFARALSMAIGMPEIVRLAAALKKGEIEDYARGRRDLLWTLVTDQRAQLRTVAAELQQLDDGAMPLAEATARHTQPALAQLHDDALRQQETLGRYVTDCYALVQACREAQGRELNIDEARRANQIVVQAGDAMQRCDEWLGQVRLERAQFRSEHSAPKKASRNSRQPSRGFPARLGKGIARKDRDSNARYVQLSTLLRKIREKDSELRIERDRAGLQLSQAARRIVAEDDVYSATAVRLEAATDDLTTALVENALVPDLLVFLGQSS